MTRSVSLAVSDSPLARRLLHAGDLTVDYLETGGPHAESAVRELPQQNLLLHNSLWNWSLAHPQALEQRDALQVTREVLRLTRAPWLSVHLGFSAGEVLFDEGMQPASAPLERESLVVQLIQTIRALKEQLDVPLLLENLDYTPTGAYEHLCQPEIIRTVLEETDTHLLLDLAHAQVSAARLGYTLHDYLEGLPLTRVRQLHVSGPRPQGDTLTDAHETLRPSDYKLLEEVLSQTQPWALTLEYARDAGALRTQLEHLRELLRRTG